MDITDADDEKLRESMEAFEAAVSAQPQVLVPPPVRSILLALDGSNQDATSAGLAVTLAERCGATVVPMIGYEGELDVEREEELRQRAAGWRERGLAVEALEEGVVDHRSRPWDQILAALARQPCDLVVLDAPFLDDFEALGHASVGTNLDVLMARTRVPLLVARAPLPEPAAAFERIALPIVVRAAHQPEAAAWALRLLAPLGRLRIVAVVDAELIARAHEWLDPGVDYEAVDEASLAGLREPKNAGLIAALQHQAARDHFRCRVSVRSGELVPTLSDIEGADPHILVTPCPRDPRDAGFQRVQALARASRAPVLIV